MKYFYVLLILSISFFLTGCNLVQKFAENIMAVRVYSGINEHDLINNDPVTVDMLTDFTFCELSEDKLQILKQLVGRAKVAYGMYAHISFGFKGFLFAVVELKDGSQHVVMYDVNGQFRIEGKRGVFHFRENDQKIWRELIN